MLPFLVACVCGDGTRQMGEDCDDGNEITEACAYGEESSARSVISSVRAGSASRVIVAMGALMHPTASSATMAIRPKTRALMATQAASSAAVAVRRLQGRPASAAMGG